jgi:hypothetical protein
MRYDVVIVGGERRAVCWPADWRQTLATVIMIGEHVVDWIAAG